MSPGRDQCPTRQRTGGTFKGTSKTGRFQNVPNAGVSKCPARVLRPGVARREVSWEGQQALREGHQAASRRRPSSASSTASLTSFTTSGITGEGPPRQVGGQDVNGPCPGGDWTRTAGEPTTPPDGARRPPPSHLSSSWSRARLAGVSSRRGRWRTCDRVGPGRASACAASAGSACVRSSPVARVEASVRRVRRGPRR